MKFILPLLLLPFAEIYLFFYMGGEFGWPKVFLWTVVTFFIGKSIIRRQNFIMSSMTSTGGSINDPLSQVLVVVSGFLIMLPGFITDTLGLLLLIPGFRHGLLSIFKKHLDRLIKSGHLKTFTSQVGFQGNSASAQTEASDMVIDVDYDVVKDIDQLSGQKN